MVFNTLHQQPNVLNTAFFSTDNVQLIQKALQDAVRKELNVNIDRQNDRDLLVIMRAVYGTTQVTSETIAKQVQRLNSSVLSHILPQVITGVKSYQYFQKDQVSPVIPLSHGIATSSKGNNTLELPVGF